MALLSCVEKRRIWARIPMNSPAPPSEHRTMLTPARGPAQGELSSQRLCKTIPWSPAAGRSCSEDSGTGDDQDQSSQL